MRYLKTKDEKQLSVRGHLQPLLQRNIKHGVIGVQQCRTPLCWHRGSLPTLENNATHGNHSQMIAGSNKLLNILNQLWLSREEEMSSWSQSAEDLDGGQLPAMGFVLLPSTD